MSIALRGSAIAIGCMIASFLLAGVILFLAGLCYSAMLALAPAWLAALTTALGVLAVALAAWALGLIIVRQPSPHEDSETAIAELVAAQALTAIRTHPHVGALTALAAGFALGASPELRHVLRKFL